MNHASSELILDIKNLTSGYGGMPVVENFNLQVIKGDFIAITGPNGCGKSTILKSIYQLCVINAGTIYYKGKLLNGKTPEQVKNLGIAYFMQRNAIFPGLSVNENLLLSLNGLKKTAKTQKIDEIISLLPDIKGWENKTAGLLSGGQRQQLSMAMLLAQNADLWLLDEFSAGLDNEKSELFLQLVLKYSEMGTSNAKTIIFVEHKPNIIERLATSIVELNI